MRGCILISKKGQMEMSITVLVLAIFFVLLFIALIFYFGFGLESFKESEDKILGQRYNIYLSHVLNMPEFKCSFLGAEKECLDYGRLNLLTNPYYRRVFGDVTKIYVEELVGSGDKITLYQYGSGTGEVYSTPVSIYHPENGKYTIGKLYVVI